MVTLAGCGDGFCFFSSRRNMIDTARMPGMAFAQTPARQIAASGGAMQPDCFGRIFGTTGIKTAVLPQHRADCILVKAQ